MDDWNWEFGNCNFERIGNFKSNHFSTALQCFCNNRKLGIKKSSNPNTFGNCLLVLNSLFFVFEWLFNVSLVKGYEKSDMKWLIRLNLFLEERFRISTFFLRITLLASYNLTSLFDVIQDSSLTSLSKLR